MLKTQIKKKANFPMKKNFWPIFSPIIGCDKPQQIIYESQQGFLTITMEVIRSFLKHLRGCWKHKIKKGKLSNEAKFLADCSRIIECDKPQKTFFEAQHGVLTITMEVTRSFL